MTLKVKLKNINKRLIEDANALKEAIRLEKIYSYKEPGQFDTETIEEYDLRLQEREVNCKKYSIELNKAKEKITNTYKEIYDLIINYTHEEKKKKEV